MAPVETKEGAYDVAATLMDFESSRDTVEVAEENSRELRMGDHHRAHEAFRPPKKAMLHWPQRLRLN